MQIEDRVLKIFGYEVPVIIKTMKEIEKVIKRNPFKKVKT